MKCRHFFLLLFVFFSLHSFAAEPPPANVVFQFKTQVSDPNTLLLSWEIKSGFFLYADRIKLSEAKDSNVHLNRFPMPKADIKKDKQGKEYPIYRHQLDLPVAVLGAEPGESIIQVRYQGCADDGFCYPPVTQAVKLSINPDLALVQAEIEHPAVGSSSTNMVKETIKTSEEEAVFAQNGFLIILSFFGFGLLLAFTPCVLPMVPVLSGIIVGHGKDITTRKAFFLSLSYVLSMAFSYALVGALVAALGSNLQIMMQSQWAIGLFSLLFVLLALSMFDFYELKLPTSWQAKLAQVTRSQSSGHYLNAAIMGFLSTLILSPCVTAPLIGALSYIAHSGDLMLGTLALFFLGLGMGTPLLLIGASAGKLLPKAGSWMNLVKYFFGFILLAMAIYLMARILPHFVSMLLWASLLIFAGVYSGATDFSGNQHRFSQSLGLILLVYGLLILIGASMGSKNPLQPLKQLHFAQTQAQSLPSEKFLTIDSVAAFNQLMAQNKGRPIMLDFYADWCSSCKIMEETTLADPKVKRAMANILWVKADITAVNDEDNKLLAHFQVVAPPTFLFFDKKGKEFKSLRITGEVGQAAFLKKLRQYQRFMR